MALTSLTSLTSLNSKKKMANYYTDHPEYDFYLNHPEMKRVVESKKNEAGRALIFNLETISGFTT